MIFSLLRLRKKTSATLAGIAVAGMCLWGLASWQNIQYSELALLLGGIVLMIVGIMLAAFALILIYKLLRHGLTNAARGNGQDKNGSN